MTPLFKYIEDTFGEQYKLTIIYSKNGDKVIFKNRFYLFQLTEREKYYDLFYLWRLGVLSIVFRKRFKQMQNIYKSVQKYAKEASFTIIETNYSA